MQQGTFIARPRALAHGTTRNGKDFSSVTLDVYELEESIDWIGYWSGGAAKFTREALSTMGWDGADAIDTERDVSIKVEPDDYNGETRFRVRWVNALGAGGLSVAPSTPGDRAALMARIRAACAATGAAPATPSKPTPSQRVAAAVAKVSANGNDDLPF